MTRGEMRRWGWGLLLIGLLSCQAPPSSSRPTESSARVTFYFGEGSHRLTTCLGSLGESHLEVKDGVLFYGRDDRIRIHTPSRPGKGISEPYHAHVFHRVMGETAEFCIVPEKDGTIEIDLSRFPDPISLIVTSAQIEIEEFSPTNAERYAFPLPPYVVSFALVPRDQAEAIVRLQSFQKTRLFGSQKLRIFVQPLNRGDMLVTQLDLDGGLDYILSQSYLSFEKENAAVLPRLVVDVSTNLLYS